MGGGRAGVQGNNTRNPAPEVEAVPPPSFLRVSRSEEKKKMVFNGSIG